MEQVREIIARHRVVGRQFQHPTKNPFRAG
jgi:hypothetical protein